jgi:Fur family ferric uptake transcriptional regulator
MKILDLMESSSVRHQSAEDIYQALRDEGEEVGLATVYRVLTQFEAAGLVTRHHFEGGQAVFELNREGHHDHIVCVSCGKVEEFVDEIIEQQQEKIADQKGYAISDHSLILYGTCPDCQKAAS